MLLFDIWISGTLIASFPLLIILLQYIDKDKKTLLPKFLSRVQDLWTNRKDYLSKGKEYYAKSDFIFRNIWNENSMHIIAIVVTIVWGRLVNFVEPQIHKRIYDEIMAKRFCYLLILGNFFLKLLGNIRENIHQSSLKKIENAIGHNVKFELFKHAQDITWNARLKRKNDISQIIFKSVWSIPRLFHDTIFTVVPTMLDLIVALIYFIDKFRSLSIILLITMVAYITATIIISKWHKELQVLADKISQTNNNIFSVSIWNSATVKYFVAEEFERKRYKESLREYFNMEYQTMLTQKVMQITQDSIIDISTLISTLIVAYSFSTGENMGDYILFTSYMRQLYRPLNYFSFLYKTFQEAFFNINRMFEFLEEEKEVDDEDAIDIPEGPCNIVFNNVSFGYVPEKLALDRVSFTVKPGETVALVGPSGCGKTTICKLLLRTFDINDGTIEIGGVDIRKLSRKSLRKHIGIVSQDISLFYNETIKHNIQYGRLDASQEEIEEAAKAANIHDLIYSKSDGYNTLLTHDGVRLSGGENQRVTIARTILKNPSIVLLDEATSALDAKTERAIKDKLDELCQERSCIVIAHRLSTVINANRIFVMKDGKFIESGRHEELLEQKGLYCEMWELQNKPRHLV